MPRIALHACLLSMVLAAPPALALSMAPEEFMASRHLACVLAQQSLGQLSEEEYGQRTHALLEDFDQAERNQVLAKALGYYDGLMFEIPDRDPTAVEMRLRDFVASPTCDADFRRVTHIL